MTDDDPVIARIRAARRKIFLEDCEGDPHKLYEYAKRLEAEHPERVVGYERPGKRNAPTETKPSADDPGT